jgi:hypothetical protein
MTTGSVKSLRNARGDAAGLLMGRRVRVRSVKMAKMAVQILRFATVESQENNCSILLSSISYAKWPTTFVGEGSYGKSRLKSAREECDRIGRSTFGSVGKRPGIQEEHLVVVLLSSLSDCRGAPSNHHRLMHGLSAPKIIAILKKQQQERIIHVRQSFLGSTRWTENCARRLSWF